MRVAILAEKITPFKLIVPAIDDHFAPSWHRDSVVSICYPYHTLNGSFRYPRGLRWADYPFSGNVAYRPVVLSGSTPPYFGTGVSERPLEPQQSKGHEIEAETLSRIRNADLIVTAYDSDHTGCHGLKRVLDHVFPEGIPVGKVVIPSITALDHKSLVSGLAEPMSDDMFRKLVSSGEIRRRFDYGFNVNALAIFRRTMRDVGIPDDAPVPSKYAVQLLYAMRSWRPFSETRIIDNMCRWQGTGAYTPDVRFSSPFGSPASRLSIMEMLERTGMIQRTLDPDETKRHRSRLGISALGLRFLDALHPRCEDPDLCFRIEEWSSLPTDLGFDKVDRYLRTYFGRQKRFLAKTATNAIPDAVPRPGAL